MLPSAVQSRLPHLPSLKKSVSSRTSSQESAYYGAVAIRDPRTSDIDEMANISLSNTTTLSVPEREDSPAPVKKLRSSSEPTESKSGICWKVANEGISFLSLAIEESSMISDDAQFSFARQLYLHSLTYLLRALPPDLTTEEQLSIRSALPQSIVLPLHTQLNSSNSSQTIPQTSTEATNTPSILHRTVASTIVNMFITIHFLLPYLKAILANAYTYERKHKICERVLSHGLNVADAWGKKMVSVTKAIAGMADGKVGKVIGEAGAWIVEGVVGGVTEGIGDGFTIFGITRGSVGEGG
ncbi:hypothetical protein B7463_g5821, partial [Scytalidium lignicola]